ncbi:hypothetical protein CMI37_39180 [Candidatus Pacearchaeota archaeon]|nr:hypothetical protein [Candidatus Pacearchaeota archaeon]|tara:strand:+ start:88 stop:480 length:393 start_codon:yes stop_codon:yes gene_type:complete
MKYKIKWESNIKVEGNSKINSSDIVKNLNDSLKEKGVAAVRLHDMRKKYPAASIFFSDVNSSHTNGGKAHTHYSRLIAHVDTHPNSLTVEFSSTVENPLEIMKVIKEIIKIIQCQKEKKKPEGLIPLAQG